MQTSDEDDLPKRSRFYQAQIDIENLNKGGKYYTLKNSYVIFLCKFDLFGKGLPVYTFTNKCHEDDIDLNDGTVKIFFNTTNYSIAKNKKMSEFLRFVDSVNNGNFNTKDGFIKKLVDEVEVIKNNKEFEVEYMSMNATLDCAELIGEKRGLEKGKKIGELEGKKIGELEGKKIRDIETATKMLKKNEPIEKIIEYSNLSLSEVESLQQEIKK